MGCFTPEDKMRALALLAVLTVALATPASAKIGTGTPTLYLGYQVSYGAELEQFEDCQFSKNLDACKTELSLARLALNDWNNCLDRVLQSHGVYLLWPISPSDVTMLRLLDYRAKAAEDLLTRGKFMTELADTCLPNGQVYVTP
jgi:hypothetical protein